MWQIDLSVSPVSRFLLSIVRFYMKYFPIPNGKGLLLRSLVIPLLGDDGKFVAYSSSGSQLYTSVREAIGVSIFLDGTFEEDELTYLRNLSTDGSTIVDVGANIGIYTIELAREVGANGMVLAFEPSPDTFSRLERNLSINEMNNVKTFQVALSDKDSTIDVFLAADPAYSSCDPDENLKTIDTCNVPCARLDTIWRDLDCPTVSVIKIDVEGMELSVLKGAELLLRMCKPVLLIEANSKEEFEEIAHWLVPFSYIYWPVKGFKKWNYLFRYENNT